MTHLFVKIGYTSVTWPIFPYQIQFFIGFNVYRNLIWI